MYKHTLTSKNIAMRNGRSKKKVFAHKASRVSREKITQATLLWGEEKNGFGYFCIIVANIF